MVVGLPGRLVKSILSVRCAGEVVGDKLRLEINGIALIRRELVTKTTLIIAARTPRTTKVISAVNLKSPVIYVTKFNVILWIFEIE